VNDTLANQPRTRSKEMLPHRARVTGRRRELSRRAWPGRQALQDRAHRAYAPARRLGREVHGEAHGQVRAAVHAAAHKQCISSASGSASGMRFETRQSAQSRSGELPQLCLIRGERRRQFVAQKLDPRADLGVQILPRRIQRIQIHRLSFIFRQ
jgi:hypothetical protein